MLRPAGSTALFLFSLISSASAADYVTSEEIRGTETWMHFTYRASIRSRDANSVFQPVPQTTTSSQVVADDPMPTLVYNCHFLPNICRNVDSHATHGGKSKELSYDPDVDRKDIRGMIACPGGWAQGKPKNSKTKPIPPDSTRPKLYTKNRAPACPDTVGATLPPGTWWSCDEFPARSTVEGGSGAQAMCASQQLASLFNKQAFTDAQAVLGQSQFGEQDFQAVLHKKLGAKPTALIDGETRNYNNDGKIHKFVLSLETNVATDTWGHLIYAQLAKETVTQTPVAPPPGGPNIETVTNTETVTTTMGIKKRDLRGWPWFTAMWNGTEADALQAMAGTGTGVIGTGPITAPPTIETSSAIGAPSSADGEPSSVIGEPSSIIVDPSSGVPSLGAPSSGAPGSSSVPESAGVPESSGAPQSTGSPESGVPESSGRPGSSGAAESSGAPESSRTPESSGVPESSGGPESSGAPEPSSVPQSSGAAESSDAPQSSAEPSAKPSPEFSAQPSAEQSAKPSAELSAELSAEPSAELSAGPSSERPAEPSAELSAQPSEGPAPSDSPAPPEEPSQTGDVVVITHTNGEETETITEFFSTSTIEPASSTFSAITTNLPDDDDDEEIVIPVWPVTRGQHGCGFPFCGIFKIPVPPFPPIKPPTIKPPFPDLPKVTIGPDGTPTPEAKPKDPEEDPDEDPEPSATVTISYTITEVLRMVTDDASAEHTGNITPEEIAEEAQDVVNPENPDGEPEPTTFETIIGSPSSSGSPSSIEPTSIDIIAAVEPSASPSEQPKSSESNGSISSSSRRSSQTDDDSTPSTTTIPIPTAIPSLTAEPDAGPGLPVIKVDDIMCSRGEREYMTHEAFAEAASSFCEKITESKMATNSPKIFRIKAKVRGVAHDEFDGCFLGIFQAKEEIEMTKEDCEEAVKTVTDECGFEVAGNTGSDGGEWLSGGATLMDTSDGWHVYANAMRMECSEEGEMDEAANPLVRELEEPL